MPNWMTVTMVADISKEPTFEMKRDFSAFDAVKPMPKVLSRTISGSVSSTVREHYDKGLGWILANCTSSPNTSVLALARCYRAKQETGYADWYDWRYMNWGVKWDIAEHSVYYDEADNRITFDVPWSFPEQGITTALSEKYPKVTFSGEFAEEQAGYFSGTFEATAGNLTVYYDDEFSDEAYERYFALYGGEEFYQYIDGKYVYIDD